MQRPIFFCHIPKTAGTVVRTIFDRAFAPDTVYPTAEAIEANRGLYPETGEAMRMVSENLDRVRLFRGHYEFSASLVLNNPLIVVLLREPIARAKSHIRHCIRHGELTFEEAAAALEAGAMPGIVPDNLMTRMLSSYSNADLAKAREVVSKADILGVVEDMDPFLIELRRIGIEAPNEFHNMGNDRIEFTPSQTEIIRRLHALDVQLYQFAIKHLARRRGVGARVAALLKPRKVPQMPYSKEPELHHYGLAVVLVAIALLISVGLAALLIA